MVRYWNIHADNDIQDSVQEEGFVGIGWDAVGDLTGLTRGEIRDQVDRLYEDEPEVTRGLWTGMLSRFVNEVTEGDVVLTSIKATQTVLVGTVSGPYRRTPNAPGHRGNTRSIRWDHAINRYKLSPKLRASIGTLLTLTNQDKHADEIDRIIAGEHTNEASDDAVADRDDEETDADRANAIETEAFERILDRLYEDFNEYEFEGLVADLLKALGFTTRGREAPGPDGGVDIVATSDALRLDPARVKVQVKHQQTAAGAPEVQQLAGTLHGQERGLFVSLGGFTAEARRIDRVALMDGGELIGLLLEHYEYLDARARERLPLRRVYLPV